MRKPESREHWLTEVEFIEAQARTPYPDRMASFETYCRMQASFAAKDGYTEIAARIIDAARRVARHNAIGV